MVDCTKQENSCADCDSQTENALTVSKSSAVLKNLAVIGAAGGVILALFLYPLLKDDSNVKFQILSEEQYPEQLAQEIIPEYMQAERALACVVDDAIYVMATRGEKPTTGFDIAINKIRKIKDGGTVRLLVHCKFINPERGAMLGQMLTYPYQVAKVNLEELPEKIELVIE